MHGSAGKHESDESKSANAGRHRNPFRKERRIAEKLGKPVKSGGLVQGQRWLDLHVIPTAWFAEFILRHSLRLLAKTPTRHSSLVTRHSSLVTRQRHPNDGFRRGAKSSTRAATKPISV